MIGVDMDRTAFSGATAIEARSTKLGDWKNYIVFLFSTGSA
jgi:hypothetical protein